MNRSFIAFNKPIDGISSFTHFPGCGGVKSPVGIAIRYELDDPVIASQLGGGARFSAPVINEPGDPPRVLYTGSAKKMYTHYKERKI